MAKTKKWVTIEGEIDSNIKQQEDCFKINKFVWNTKDLKINANGKLFKDNTFIINTFLQGNPAKILAPPLERLTVKGLFYGNARISKDKNKKLTIKGKFNASTFSSGGESFSNLIGNVNWDNLNKHLRVNAFFSDNQLRASLNVDLKKDKAKIQGSNISGNKLAKMIDLYRDVPIGGRVKECDITAYKRIISGTVTLDKQNIKTSDFNLKGTIQFSYDSKKKIVDFNSDQIFTEIGEIAIQGNTRIREKRLTINIKSSVNKMEYMDKYSQYFINLDLVTWKLKGGNGRFRLKLNKKKDELAFTSSFNFANFTSHDQKIKSLKGKVNGNENLVKADFTISDNQLQGKAKMTLDDSQTKIEFSDINGESYKILRILDIDIPIQGKTNGYFSFTEKKDETPPSVKGKFKSEKLKFYGINFDRVTGNLESNLDDIKIKNLGYFCHQGKGYAEIFIDYKNEKFHLNGEVNNININQISSSFNGNAGFSFNGKGQFNKDPIRIKYHLDNLHFYKDRISTIIGQANIITDFSNYKLKTIGHLNHENGQSPFNINLNQVNSQFSGFFKLHLKDINQIIPWRNNSGRLILNGQILNNESGEISVQGIATVDGKVLVFPSFPHSLNDFKALITFKDLNFTLSSLQGEMGKGTVDANGFLSIKDKKINDFFINLIGKKMTLFLMDRTSATVNTDLSLKYLKDRLLLQGTINFLSALWEREIDEDISFYSHPNPTKAESTLLDMLYFDINLIGKDNIRMVNSFGNINNRIRLRLTGDNDFPILIGVVESKDGKVNFSDKAFNLIKAKLIFNNKFLIDPLVDVQSEAFLSNYRIRFNIKGKATKLKPEFHSSPPLPPQDILALISLGEFFKRPTSTEMSSQISATSLGTTKLTEQIEKRLKNILGIDFLKVDPMLNGTTIEGESRVSVGKSIAKDFLIVYSTNIASTRQEILYLQYQISPGISLIGMKNEEGRFSIDIRFRKRR